ncbi:MAG: transcriptional regulator with XRE-family HTH domain [Flavobacteriales bacterium]|jgi:transcriptional regulator with XRE-family HTH domain
MNYLPTNLKVLRKARKLTQSGLAEKIGVNRSAIGAYEESRADPRVQTLIRIGLFFKLKVDDLLNKDMRVQETKSYVADQLRVLPIIVDKDSDKELIPLIPEKAAAGYLNNYNDPEFVSELPRFRMPFPQLSGDRTYRMFQIAGESMLPVPSGAYIISQYVSSLDEMKVGECYVFTTLEEGLVYKRLEGRQGTELMLQSDNPDFASFSIKDATILEVWKALGYTSFDLPDSGTYQPELHEISTAIKSIQAQLKEKEKGKN